MSFLSEFKQSYEDNKKADDGLPVFKLGEVANLPVTFHDVKIKEKLKTDYGVNDTAIVHCTVKIMGKEATGKMFIRQARLFPFFKAAVTAGHDFSGEWYTFVLKTKDDGSGTIWDIEDCQQ